MGFAEDFGHRHLQKYAESSPIYIIKELEILFYCRHESDQKSKVFGSGGIRTHASEETGALNQRLRPLGHATFLYFLVTIQL